ncbi:MAG: pyridoxine 5'-phosphate synthase [Opitutales bacterium]
MKRNAILLGVNIDHAATLRQARYRDMERDCGQMVEPDPVFLALLAEQAGADSITVHLREDRRHIQEMDVWRLRESLTTRLNLEMACTKAMRDFAIEVKPDSVCLVPEGRLEVTTEGGLDVSGQKEKVKDTVWAMRDAGIVTSLFIDPEPEQIEAAAELESPVIELHTGAYANAFYSAERDEEYERLKEGCRLAFESGLTVNAGHGINYLNISEIVALPHLQELNIGHSIICRALFRGVDEAVREMKRRMQRG